MIKAKVKKFIKSIISKYPSYTAEGIISRIRNFDYVSFDIFDTLVKRAVSEPDDIFRIMAKKCSSDSSFPAFINEFHEVRTASEKTARNAALQAGREDTTLTEIYGCLPERYSAPLKNKLMALEIAQEKACCHANPVMRRVYQWCKENKKHIIVISDMYLPLDCVKEILSQCGYDEYDRLFLSSDVGLTKTSGNLYSCALGCMQIEARKLAHIGDNVRGDYIKAKKQGIKAVWIARDPQRTKFIRLNSISKEEKEVVRPIIKIMNNQIDPSWDRYYQYGYEVIGPLLYSFSLWLHQSVLADSVEKLFFISRDGFLIQNAYRYLWEEKALESNYLYASRRALMAPQIWINPTYEDVLKMLPNYKQSTCESICDILGIDKEIGKKLWIECGFKETQAFFKKDMATSSTLRNFFEAVKNDIIDNSKREFALFQRYLEQNDFNGSIGIVDVGWNGNLQRCLNVIVSKIESLSVRELRGYYLGLSEIAKNELHAKAFIKRNSPQLGCAGLIELCFPPSEGSTRSYINGEDGTVVPALYAYEYQDRPESEIVLSIQAGAMDFLKILKPYKDNNCFFEFGWKNFEAILTRPNKKEVSMFGEMLFFDTALRPLASPKPFTHYLIHPQNAYRDLLNSGWGIGFLKKLLPLPLPYASILRVLKKWGK